MERLEWYGGQLFSWSDGRIVEGAWVLWYPDGCHELSNTEEPVNEHD
jgi:hypothetical protein